MHCSDMSITTGTHPYMLRLSNAAMDIIKMMIITEALGWSLYQIDPFIDFLHQWNTGTCVSPQILFNLYFHVVMDLYYSLLLLWGI